MTPLNKLQQKEYEDKLKAEIISQGRAAHGGRYYGGSTFEVVTTKSLNPPGNPETSSTYYAFLMVYPPPPCGGVGLRVEGTRKKNTTIEAALEELLETFRSQNSTVWQDWPNCNTRTPGSNNESFNNSSSDLREG